MREIFDIGREAGHSLKLSMPRRAMRGNIGERLGSGTGSSLEFQDYREYRPGDDIRRLDWAAYARNDKLTVRLFRDEIQPRVDICSDFSASMIYPLNNGKYESVLYLSGLLAEASFRAASSVSWWSFGRSWQRIFPYSQNLPEFIIPAFDGMSDPEEGLASASQSFGRNSVRIVISDFLWEKSPEPILRRISDSASEVILLALLSEEELNPPLYGPTTMIDSEDNLTPLEIVVTEKERETYLKRLESHIHLWEDAALSCGAKWKLLKTMKGTYPSPAPLVDDLILNFE